MHSEALQFTYILLGFGVERMSMMLNSDSQTIGFQLLLGGGVGVRKQHQENPCDPAVPLILVWRIQLAHVQLITPLDIPVALLDLLEFGV